MGIHTVDFMFDLVSSNLANSISVHLSADYLCFSMYTVNVIYEYNHWFMSSFPIFISLIIFFYSFLWFYLLDL